MASKPDGFITADTPEALAALEQLRAESELLRLIMSQSDCNLSHGPAGERTAFIVLIDSSWVDVNREQYELFNRLRGDETPAK